jgi:hypothetical protein
MTIGLPDRTTASRRGARGLERVLELETQLARTPVISRRRLTLTKAIGIAATAYRKGLDAEQATAMHERPPLDGARRAAAQEPPSPTRRRSKRSQP